MLVEDARRLLVSNLDLLDLSWILSRVASVKDRFGKGGR
jgi:hypothetical protein